MERLTKRDKYGHWYTNSPIYDRGMSSKDGIHFIKYPDVSAYDGKAINKLAKYEDLEEQGLLHIAPLKDGTPIFVIEEDWVFDGIERYITKTSYLHGVTEYEIGELNKDYWLAYEEAEKVLRNEYKTE